MTVADGVWFVQGQAALGSLANRNFISNAGFIVTDAGVVDALGSPAMARESGRPGVPELRHAQRRLEASREQADR